MKQFDYTPDRTLTTEGIVFAAKQVKAIIPAHLTSDLVTSADSAAS